MLFLSNEDAKLHKDIKKRKLGVNWDHGTMGEDRRGGDRMGGKRRKICSSIKKIKKEEEKISAR